ncbi:MAG: triose-phosphate isomerase [Oscillospiraceae bacterium]
MAARMCNANASGAYTGEIAANMLVDAGCKYVIIGHSERRAMGETDADVNAKVLAALEAGLIPILCCGESLSSGKPASPRSGSPCRSNLPCKCAGRKDPQAHHRLRAHLGHRHRPHRHPGAGRGSL